MHVHVHVFPREYVALKYVTLKTSEAACPRKTFYSSGHMRQAMQIVVGFLLYSARAYAAYAKVHTIEEQGWPRRQKS